MHHFVNSKLIYGANLTHSLSRLPAHIAIREVAAGSFRNTETSRQAGGRFRERPSTGSVWVLATLQ